MVPNVTVLDLTGHSLDGPLGLALNPSLSFGASPSAAAGMFQTEREGDGSGAVGAFSANGVSSNGVSSFPQAAGASTFSPTKQKGGDGSSNAEKGTAGGKQAKTTTTLPQLPTSPLGDVSTSNGGGNGIEKIKGDPTVHLPSLGRHFPYPDIQVNHQFASLYLIRFTLPC